jgi:sugar phosphate permease
MNAGGGKHWASPGGIGSIGANLDGYLPGIVTDAKSWDTVSGDFVGGIVLSATILVPLWRLKPPTSRSS